MWKLLPGQSFAHVELSLVPAADGQVSLGYEMFFRRDLSAIDELLLPMMYHRKRLPASDVTLLSNTTPTPLALVQSGGGSAVSLAVVADPRDIPYQWPDGRLAPYALSIRGPGATVQPAIYGPVHRHARRRGVEGAEGAVALQGSRGAGRLVRGVSHDGRPDLRADRLTRQNVRTSLTDAVYNMIELFLDDDHGGWWQRAKAPYQIESKNSSTHSTPMLPLSLYRLTNDSRLLDRRVLPTLAFMLSRDGAHFSPVPDDSGHYSLGSMNGPVKMFGTTTYAGLWELTGRRTPAFLEIAAPAGETRPTAGYSHGTAFLRVRGPATSSPTTPAILPKRANWPTLTSRRP